MTRTVAGVALPTGAMPQAALEHMRDRESEWLTHHSHRAFLFGVLAADRSNREVDVDLLYTAALFHNAGLHAQYHDSHRRFEVDGADVARAFLQGYPVTAQAVQEVWTAIALHTTPGIPEYMSPLIAVLTAGIQMDVRGSGYCTFTAQQRKEILEAFPRAPGFKEDLLAVYASGMMRRPATTFGTVNADVLDRADPDYRRLNFCGLVLGSEWTH